LAHRILRHFCDTSESHRFQPNDPSAVDAISQSLVSIVRVALGESSITRAVRTPEAHKAKLPQGADMVWWWKFISRDASSFHCENSDHSLFLVSFSSKLSFTGTRLQYKVMAFMECVRDLLDRDETAYILHTTQVHITALHQGLQVISSIFSVSPRRRVLWQRESSWTSFMTSSRVRESEAPISFACTTPRGSYARNSMGSNHNLKQRSFPKEQNVETELNLWKGPIDYKKT
jgi:hypothetical protein